MEVLAHYVQQHGLPAKYLSPDRLLALANIRPVAYSPRCISIATRKGENECANSCSWCVP
jgi:hypothetical protein